MRLKQTRDGKFIIAAGVYKPHFRVFELAEMSMKFDRHTDCETVQFQILSEDWRKMVFLQADRSIEFHSPMGMHYRTRIPRFGRDLAYMYPTCDLLAAGAGNQVFRLNLEQGQFLNPFETDCPGVNCMDISPAHQLLSLGGEDGHVEFWDARARRRVGRFDVGEQIVSQWGSSASAFQAFPEITQLKFHSDGLTYGVGTKTGQVLLYDLRTTKPMLTRDHQYEQPIRKIMFHQDGHVISADTKIIKIWNKDTGKPYTSIEPENDINDVLVDSGLVMTANESPRMNIFFIPSLGPAPRWCSFLDNLTEELEESHQQNTWDDYKFVTRKELSHLGLDHLVGTNLLKAYMHGFFVDLRLYEKARAIANPFAYDDFKKRLAKERIEKETESRISAVRKLPKVNKGVAQRLLANAKPPKDGEEDKEVVAKNPLGDSRFADMFTNPDFEVDEDVPEFARYHPSVAAKKSQLASQFAKVNEDGSSESELEGRGSDEESLFADSDASEELVSRRHQKNTDQKKKSTARKGPAAGNTVQFFEGESGRTWDQMLEGSRDSKSAQRNLSFGDRLKKSSNHTAKKQSSRVTSGAMSMTYRPTTSGRGRGRGGGPPRTGRKFSTK